MKKEEVFTLLEKARATNDRRDQMDSKNGFAPPSVGGSALWARTIICALQAGLMTDDINAIAEGLVMLVDLEFSLRDKDSKAKPARKYEPWK